MTTSGESGSTTIPLLPAVSLDDSLSFWQTLGFEVALRQKAPNAYAVVRYEDFELHLFGLKRLEPEGNFTTCLVIVSEVEQLHALYAGRLNEELGRAPYRGLPRLSRMRPGQTRFTVTDVAGNSVIFVKRGGEDDEAAAEYKQAGLTPLQRALALAERERDFKTDDAGAARVLDIALKRYAGDRSPEYRRALEARLELADIRDEHDRADELRSLLTTIPPAQAGTSISERPPST
jgi:hypothetical protein